MTRLPFLLYTLGARVFVRLTDSTDWDRKPQVTRFRNGLLLLWQTFSFGLRRTRVGFEGRKLEEVRSVTGREGQERKCPRIEVVGLVWNSRRPEGPTKLERTVQVGRSCAKRRGHSDPFSFFGIHILHRKDREGYHLHKEVL